MGTTYRGTTGRGIKLLIELGRARLRSVKRSLAPSVSRAINARRSRAGRCRALRQRVDVPVGIAAGQIGQTPYVQTGALERVAQATKEDVEWSIEVEPVPIVAGGSVRGTLLVAPTDKWQKTRPEMKVEAHVVRQNLLPGRLDLIMQGKATDDGVDAEGRRRIRFEANIPAAAPVTTGVGEVRVLATLQINLVRFGFFGPSFKRPVAIASRA